jgi:hypothetical protein
MIVFMCARSGCFLLVLVGGWCSIAVNGAMLFLLSFCVIYPPLQRAALRNLLQRGAMHPHMLRVCTVYLHPYVRTPSAVGGIEI